MRPQRYIAGLIFTLLLTTAFANDIVKAPRGWDDNYVGQTRVVSSGNSTVRIEPWKNLQGSSIEQWLTSIEQQDPTNGRVISSAGVKPESVSGAFAVTRKARFDGKKGYSVLYGCPGQSGHARLITLDMRDGGFVDFTKAAKFGENVCKKEPKGVGSSDDSPRSETRRLIGPGVVFTETKTAGKSISKEEKQRFTNITDDELKKLNQEIPVENRPIGANTYGDWGFFGGSFQLKIRFTLLFSNGIETRCTNWDPAGDFPSSENLARSRCRFSSDDLLGKAHGFKPGERIEVEYRTYEQLRGYDYSDNVSYKSIGGNLKMNLDGTIGNSKSSSSYQSDLAATVSTGKNETINGRYYLNGHTITILTDQGDVVHGYVGYDREDDNKLARIYYNGAMYWNWRD